MEAIILSTQQYKDLINRLDDLNKQLEEKQKKPQDTFLDNQEFLQLMNISKRTAQTWRDEGVISFATFQPFELAMRNDETELAAAEDNLKIIKILVEDRSNKVSLLGFPN